jgi:hypothetical protein
MNIRKNSAESQLYNKTQIKYNVLNRYDKEKEYKLKKAYAIRPFLSNSTYGTNNSGLNMFTENPFYTYSNMPAYN